MQEFYSDPSDLDGFDELKPEDKERIKKALQDGRVAEDDIPESAKKEGPAAEGTKSKGKEKPNKKAASRKRRDTEAEGEAVQIPQPALAGLGITLPDRLPSLPRFPTSLPVKCWQTN